MKIRLCLLATCMFLTCGLFAASPQDDRLASVEISSLKTLVDDMIGLGRLFQVPVEDAELLAKLTDQIAGIDSAAGLDMDEPIWMDVHVPSGDDAGEPFVVFDVAVTDDGADYLAALSESWDAGEATNGIHTFTRMVEKFGHPMPESRYVRLTEGRALISGSLTGLAALDGELDRASLGFPGSVALEAKLNELGVRFQKMMTTQAASMREMFSAMPPEQLAEMDTSFIDSMEQQGEMVASACSNLDRLALALHRNGSLLDAHVQLSAMAGSVLGNLFERLEPPVASLATLVSPSAWAGSVSGLEMTDEFIDAYMEWMDSMVGAMPDEAARDDVMELAKMGMALHRGQSAGGYGWWVESVDEAVPFLLAQVYRIRDAEVMTGRIEPYFAQFEARIARLLEEDEAAEVPSIERREYRGAVIFKSSVDTMLGDPAVSRWLKTALPKITSLVSETAVTDDLLVTVMGGSNAMNQVIDRIRDQEGTPFANHQVLQRHFPELPADEAVELSAMNPLAALSALARLIPDFPADIAEDLAGLEAAISGYSTRDGVTSTSVIRMDIEGLAMAAMGMKDWVQAAFTQAMQEFGAPPVPGQ